MMQQGQPPDPDVGGHFVSFTVPISPTEDISCRMNPYDPSRVLYEVTGENEFDAKAFTSKVATAQSTDQLGQYIWQASEPARLELAGGTKSNGYSSHQPETDDPLGHTRPENQVGKVTGGVSPNGRPPAQPQPTPPIALPGAMEDEDPDDEKVYTHSDVAHEVILALDRNMIHTLHGLLKVHMDKNDAGWAIVEGQITNYEQTCKAYGAEPLFDSGKKQK